MEGPTYSIEKIDRLAYLLTLPHPDPTAPGPHPILLFLHGYDEGPPTPLETALTRHGPLRRDNRVRALQSFILVAPQMPARGDIWYRYQKDVVQLAAHVQRAYGGDSRRICLSGFSYGGNGVFDIALHSPGIWSALWAVDPTRPPARDPGRPLWLSVGPAARPSIERFVQLLKLRPFDDKSESARVILDEGADHVGAATLAFRDERIYSWLLARRL